MDCQFVYSGVRAVRRSPYPRSFSGRQIAPTASVLASTNPLRPLLTSLRGRDIGVMTSDREVNGKLVVADPVTLVDTDGVTTLIPLDRVLSIRF